eukprot:276676_1
MVNLALQLLVILNLMFVNAVNASEELKCETDLFETIDVNAFMAGNKTIKDKIAKQFDFAMSKLGMLYLSNHGVNINAIHSLYNATKTFFHLSSQEKSKYIGGNYLGTNGYHPFGFEKLDKSNKKVNSGADLVENYYVCNKGYNWYFSDPSWSNIPNEFINNNINIMKQYVIELRLLLYRIHILAIYALNIERNYFEEYLIDNLMDNTYENYGQFCLRLNYYFPINESHVNMTTNMRLGSHSDYRSFTLLYTDEIKGLQTMYKNKWINVNNKKDTFILNAGDFIELWTMKKWKSGIHRVYPITNEERISMTYFTGPRGNVIIEPFQECLKKTAQQYLNEKYQNAHYD